MRKGGIYVATMGVGLSAMSSCLDPTEIVVELSTNVPCSTVGPNGVAIALGVPGDDMSGIVTSTTQCSSDGGIGSLVVTPSGADDVPVGIRVTLGVSTSADSCQPPTFAGCIVARRSLRYAPHTPLTLPILLDSQCADVPCDPNSTCVDGTCVDAGVTGCVDGVCEIPDASLDASDAGPTCVETTTPIVVENAPAVATPHIARTPTGYAVSWVTSDAYVHVATYGPDGSVVDNGIALTQLGDAGPTLGPIGSDGKSYGTVVSSLSNPAPVLWYALTDGGAAIGDTTPTNGVAPVAGVFYDTSLGKYVTSLISSSQFVGFATWLGGSSSTNGSTVGGGIDAVSLAASSASYYVATHNTNQACSVYGCTVNTTTLTLICNGSPVVPTLNQCTSIRAAVRDDGDMIAPYYDVTAGVFTVHTFVGGAVVDAVESVDDGNSFVPLVTGPTPYRLVWRMGDALYTRDFPTPTTPATMLRQLNYGQQGGAGAGFDAVADDPVNSSGYAVVYWSNTGGGTQVFFEHHCK